MSKVLNDLWRRAETKTPCAEHYKLLVRDLRAALPAVEAERRELVEALRNCLHEMQIARMSRITEYDEAMRMAVTVLVATARAKEEQS